LLASSFLWIESQSYRERCLGCGKLQKNRILQFSQTANLLLEFTNQKLVGIHLATPPRLLNSFLLRCYPIDYFLLDPGYGAATDATSLWEDARPFIAPDRRTAFSDHAVKFWEPNKTNCHVLPPFEMEA
jgi:hypothetical protein